jgi:hypothetical protein
LAGILEADWGGVSGIDIVIYLLYVNTGYLPLLQLVDIPHAMLSLGDLEALGLADFPLTFIPRPSGTIEVEQPEYDSQHHQFMLMEEDELEGFLRDQGLVYIFKYQRLSLLRPVSRLSIYLWCYFCNFKEEMVDKMWADLDLEVGDEASFWERLGGLSESVKKWYPFWEERYGVSANFLIDLKTLRGNILSVKDGMDTLVENVESLVSENDDIVTFAEPLYDMAFDIFKQTPVEDVDVEQWVKDGRPGLATTGTARASTKIRGVKTRLSKAALQLFPDTELPGEGVTRAVLKPDDPGKSRAIYSVHFDVFRAWVTITLADPEPLAGDPSTPLSKGERWLFMFWVNLLISIMNGTVHMPFDFAAFDHQPKLKQISDILAALFAWIYLNVGQEYRQHTSFAVGVISMILFSSIVVVMMQEYLRLNGLLSGEPYTSVVGTVFNKALWISASGDVNRWLGMVVIAALACMGDDQDMECSDRGTAVAMYYRQKGRGALANDGKNFINDTTEFLRHRVSAGSTVTPVGGIGYIARTCNKWVERNPLSERPATDGERASRLYSLLCSTKARGGDDARVNALYRRLLGKIKDRAIHSPVSLSGYGFGTSSISYSRRKNPAEATVIGDESALRAQVAKIVREHDLPVSESDVARVAHRRAVGILNSLSFNSKLGEVIGPQAAPDIRVPGREVEINIPTMMRVYPFPPADLNVLGRWYDLLGEAAKMSQIGSLENEWWPIVAASSLSGAEKVALAQERGIVFSNRWPRAVQLALFTSEVPMLRLPGNWISEFARPVFARWIAVSSVMRFDGFPRSFTFTDWAVYCEQLSVRYAHIFRNRVGFISNV